MPESKTSPELSDSSRPSPEIAVRTRSCSFRSAIFASISLRMDSRLAGLSAPEMLLTICCMRPLLRLAAVSSTTKKSSRFVMRSA